MREVSNGQTKQVVPLSTVVSSIVRSWVPIIIAGIVVYIVYYLTVHVYNILPHYLGNYEYLVRLALA